MTFDTQAAGFFTANDDRFSFHESADVFETDGGFMNGDTENLRDRIHLMTGGNGADDRACPAAILFQMIKGQSKNLVGCEPGSILIYDTKAVGITIEPKT